MNSPVRCWAESLHPQRVGIPTDYLLGRWSSLSLLKPSLTIQLKFPEHLLLNEIPWNVIPRNTTAKQTAARNWIRFFWSGRILDSWFTFLVELRSTCLDLWIRNGDWQGTTNPGPKERKREKSWLQQSEEHAIVINAGGFYRLMESQAAGVG